MQGRAGRVGGDTAEQDGERQAVWTAGRTEGGGAEEEEEMKVRFSSYLEIDTDHIPDDFDDLILKAFQKFTDGTSKDYTYQEKIC